MSTEEGHTTIRIRIGGVEIRHASQNGGFDFNATVVTPLRSDPRYSLNLQTLCRIERLAKARFIIAKKSPTLDPTKLDKKDEDTIRSIALGVFASSEIDTTSMVVKRMARGRLLFVSHTAQTLKPKTVSSTFRMRLLRLRSSGAFSLVTFP